MATYKIQEEEKNQKNAIGFVKESKTPYSDRPPSYLKIYNSKYKHKKIYENKIDLLKYTMSVLK